MLKTKIETLRKTIFSGWNFMRWFRLAIGLFITFQAIEMHNGLLGGLAGLFVFQALANMGCCGATGCTVEPRPNKKQDPADVKFEEIKIDN